MKVVVKTVIFSVFLSFTLFTKLSYSNDCDVDISKVLLSKNDSLIANYLNKENRSYFEMLFLKYKTTGKQSKEIAIFEEGLDLSGKQVVFPTAMSPDKMMKSLSVYQYNDFLDNSAIKEAAKEVTLIIQKMNGGTGSSFKRSKYLSELLDIAEEKIVHGAKGTDLYIPFEGKLVSFAEAQLIQAYLKAHSGEFHKVITNDLVGPETRKSLKKIWNKTSYFDKTKTWKELFDSDPKISKGKTTFQDHLPTIDESGRVSINRKAPGGHAYFAFNALMDALDPIMSKKLKSSILAIGNGEDLSSVPDNIMIGMMKKLKLGIVMVTTKKMPVDIKNGGQIALAKEGNLNFTTIIEKAQAETSGQLKYFQELGVSKGVREAMFNTNLTLFNYEVLIPKFQKLLKDVGSIEKVWEIIAPDLIKNNKKQLDTDGIYRIYTQLEAAMGSVVLNLDKEWRKRYGKPLVTFINIDDKTRTKFFAPLKHAFDFFIQVFSDRFVLNKKIMQYENTRPGTLPAVKLDPYYDELANVLADFSGIKLKYLENLIITGRVNLKNIELKGNIKIISDIWDESPSFEALLKQKQNRRFLKKHALYNDDGGIYFEEKSIWIMRSGKIGITY